MCLGHLAPPSATMQALSHVGTAGVRCSGSAAQRRLQRTAAHVAPSPCAAAVLPSPLLLRAPTHARAVVTRAVSVRAAAADGAAGPGAQRSSWVARRLRVHVS